ncbi:Exonuclease 1, partial [Globisporangium splendens]
MSATKRDVLALYRRIVRESRRLEPDARQYYLHFARSGFTGHSDETDPERIQEIIARVEQDMDWILRKYTGSGLATTKSATSEQ